MFPFWQVLAVIQPPTGSCYIFSLLHLGNSPQCLLPKHVPLWIIVNGSIIPCEAALYNICIVLSIHVLLFIITKAHATAAL